MFERFSHKARGAIVRSQEAARSLSHHSIGTEHLLLGLIADGDNVAAHVLTAMGINQDAVRQQVEQAVGCGEQSPSGAIPFAPETKRALELALRESLQLGDGHIGTEHLLLGLIREGGGVAAQVLAALGADLSRAWTHVISVQAGYEDSGGRPEEIPLPYARPSRGAVSPGPVSRASSIGIGSIFAELTPAARRVTVFAQEEALRLNHSHIGTEHLLLGLLRDQYGLAARVLDPLGVSLTAVRQQVEQVSGRGLEAAPSGALPYTPRAKKVFTRGLQEAIGLGDGGLGPEHLLLGLLREEDGQAAQLLVRLGADLDQVRQQVIQLRSEARS